MTEHNEFRLYDGTIIGGTSASELVASMARTKFTSPRSQSSYRRATKRRTAAQYPGVTIDDTTDESFIDSLRQAELLVPVLP